VSAYLGPPVAQPSPSPSLQRAVTRLRRAGEPRLDRYETPRHRGGGFIDIVSTPPSDRYTALTPPETTQSGIALRHSLRATGYDYVLMDCPTQPTEPMQEAMQSALAHLCDSIVVCFRPGVRWVPEVLKMFPRLLGGRADPPQLVAVLTQFGPAHHPAAEHLRHLQDAFAQLQT